MNFAAAVLPLLPKGGEGRGEEALYAAVHGKVFGAHSGGEPLRSLPTPKSCITYSICPICRPLVYRNVARVMQKVNHMSRSESGLRPKASTLDILGGAIRKRKINPEWREPLDRLRELREQMMDSRRTLASDAKEERATYSIHMADAASDTYDSDWALSMLSSDQNALFEIEQAINRIENGTYGQCELTGQPIEPERLKAIPWTRFSMEAQKQLEDQGVVSKTRLAERRGLSDSEEVDSEEVEEVAS